MAVRPSKRSLIPPSMFTSNLPIWKVKPPGPEQIELERMFRENEIDASFSADSVRKSKEMFRKFSAQVFATHFRITRAKCGLAATLPPNTESIAELGSSKNNVRKTQEEIELDSEHPPEDKTINFVNPPYTTWMYTDFERKIDYVCVIVPIISGSEDVDFTLSNDGMELDIFYTWPRVVLDPALFFEEDIQRNRLSLTHPKVHAFYAELAKNGLTEKSTPTGHIKITLPCKVMRQASSWTKSALTIKGTNCAYLVFTAYQKEIFIEDADTSLKFN